MHKYREQEEGWKWDVWQEERVERQVSRSTADLGQVEVNPSADRSR